VATSTSGGRTLTTKATNWRRNLRASANQTAPVPRPAVHGRHCTGRRASLRLLPVQRGRTPSRPRRSRKDPTHLTLPLGCVPSPGFYSRSGTDDHHRHEYMQSQPIHLLEDHDASWKITVSISRLAGRALWIARLFLFPASSGTRTGRPRFSFELLRPGHSFGSLRVLRSN
jgi:hypothetical protein